MKRQAIQWAAWIVCVGGAIVFIGDLQAAYAIDRRTVDGVVLFALGLGLGAVVGYGERR